MARTSPSRSRPPAAVRLTRRTRSRVLGAGLAVLAVGVPVALPTHGSSAVADDLKDRQHHVRQGISSTQDALEDSSHAQVVAMRRLAGAKAQLGAAQTRLASTRESLTTAEIFDGQVRAELQQAVRALAESEHRLVQGRADVHEQRRQLGELAAADFQNGSPAMMGLSAMLTSSTPADVSSQMNTVDNLMARAKETLGRLKATEARLRVQARQVQAGRDAVAARQEQAAANVTRMEQLTGRADAEATQVAQLVSSRADAEQLATRSKRDDLRQLAELTTENARIKRQILARAARAARLRRERLLRAQQAQQAQQGTAASGYTGATNGYLTAPVVGPITSPFGYRVHPIYGYYSLHDGTDFGAACGTPLTAVADGQVVSEYYQTAWGHRLLVDLGEVNGKNVTVIYNHLSAYRVGDGASVKRGETLGYVGTTGWSTGCHLHFTVLVDGDPVDPMTWIG